MGAAPSATRGGAPCAAQPIRASDGTPGLPTRAREAPRCADGGRRQALWRAQWEPFGLTRSCTDGWGADERPGAAEQHTLGKAHPQTSERTPSPWRTRSTRWVRRTLCGAKTERRHDVGSGCFINRSALGRLLGDGNNSSETPSRLLRTRGHVWQGEGRWTCLPIRTRPI